jgi:hypothetical protein
MAGRFSDEPCVGARRIDVEPTRGFDKITGRERIGRDVEREKRPEALVKRFDRSPG